MDEVLCEIAIDMQDSIDYGESIEICQTPIDIIAIGIDAAIAVPGKVHKFGAGPGTGSGISESAGRPGNFQSRIANRVQWIAAFQSTSADKQSPENEQDQKDFSHLQNLHSSPEGVICKGEDFCRSIMSCQRLALYSLVDITTSKTLYPQTTVASPSSMIAY